MWKGRDSGKAITVHSNDVKTASWFKAAKACYVKLQLVDNGVIKLEGFGENVCSDQIYLSVTNIVDRISTLLKIAFAHIILSL